MAGTDHRYIELDALRGIAVMGIILMNILSFAMPEMAYFSPKIYGGMGQADVTAWTFDFIFVDGKMRGLFTLLFGASMMLVIERAAISGQNEAKVHFSRMGWLAIFGLLHFFLFWMGDILFLYAAVGSIAFFMADERPEALIRYALLIFFIGFMAYAALFGAMLYDQSDPGLPTSAAEIADEVVLYRSDFGAILNYKLTYSLLDPVYMILYNITETLPLMLIGMALYKNGFMIGSWSGKSYRIWGYCATAVGIIFLIGIVFIIYAADFDLLILLNANWAWSLPSQLLMTVGYAALMILAIKRLTHYPLLENLTAVGRMAFTNYLGTTLIMTFIFYGWGLGLFGKLSRAELYLFIPPLWAAMMLWSKPWLSRFRYGPLEWLWRSLARGKLQPMRVFKRPGGQIQQDSEQLTD